VLVGRDDDLVAGLRRRDPDVVAELVERWSDAMLRLALVFLPERGAAEDVVQEAWIRALAGIERFEGRSSLRTWVLGIVVNLARARARRERLSLPFSALSDEAPEVEKGSFLPDQHVWAGHWASAPRPPLPEERLLAGEVRQRVGRLVRGLPTEQRAVVVLRDFEGLPAEEVCALLDLSEGYQRVLLHRARSRLRDGLARYLEGTTE
jgi:RNA polymerase sigma-70 factor (ECF subfamily)